MRGELAGPVAPEGEGGVGKHEGVRPFVHRPEIAHHLFDGLLTEEHYFPAPDVPDLGYHIVPAARLVTRASRPATRSTGRTPQIQSVFRRPEFGLRLTAKPADPVVHSGGHKPSSGFSGMPYLRGFRGFSLWAVGIPLSLPPVASSPPRPSAEIRLILLLCQFVDEEFVILWRTGCWLGVPHEDLLERLPRELPKAGSTSALRVVRDFNSW